MTLEEIAKKMCARGKGILAADESTGTIAKRFKSINVENSEKNRLIFRQTLFNSSAMKDYIGGVILFDETIRQKTTMGLTIPELISKNGAIPGIKVDKGAKSLAGSADETVTEGLDGLRERLKEYYDLGARFTKWRAVYKITEKFPSSQSLKSNAHALARYAALVQEAKMVPIIEPEVLLKTMYLYVLLTAENLALNVLSTLLIQFIEMSFGRTELVPSTQDFLNLFALVSK